MSTINENIFDELVAHQLDIFRITAGVRKDVDRRLMRLKRDMAEAIKRIDPAGTPRTDYREARMKRLTAEVRELIRKCFSDIRTMTNEEFKTLAQAESVAVASKVEKAAHAG